MRIVLDVSPLSRPRTGIGNYVRGMVAGLADVAVPAHEVVAFAPTGPRGKRRIQKALAPFPVEQRLLVLPRAHAWRTTWSRLGRPTVDWLLGPFDVFHFSDWMYPRQQAGIRVTTIHDLVPLRHPEWVQRRTVSMHVPKYRNAAETCDLLVVNSQFTAGEVTELLGVPEERIRVAYPGLDPVFSAEGPRADIGAPYVLAVATLEPRKNLPELVQAFALLRRRRPELRLAVVGASGWGKLPPLEREGVNLLGYVEDERLAELYRGASVFAYPSLFEGFGMPVAEALASGVPVVASSHSSLDEASGDAAWRADPADREAFADALDRALDTPPEAIERGRRHAARFTWTAAGRALLTGYENALTN